MARASRAMLRTMSSNCQVLANFTRSQHYVHWYATELQQAVRSGKRRAVKGGRTSDSLPKGNRSTSLHRHASAFSARRVLPALLSSTPGGRRPLLADTNLCITPHTEANLRCQVVRAEAHDAHWNVARSVDNAQNTHPPTDANSSRPTNGTVASRTSSACSASYCVSAARGSPGLSIVLARFYHGRHALPCACYVVAAPRPSRRWRSFHSLSEVIRASRRRGRVHANSATGIAIPATPCIAGSPATPPACILLPGTRQSRGCPRTRPGRP